MKLVQIPSVALGVNTDLMPEELADGTWSSLTNMQVRDGHLERAKGMLALFATPSITPYWVAPFRTAGKLYWLHVGLTKAYVDDGTTRTEVGRVAAYTGTASDRWNGGTFNGYLVFTNGIDPPQSWDGTTSRAVNLVNWTANYKCKAIKGFKNVLVALDITTNTGVRYPYRMRWSEIADTGALPPSWDVADPTKNAGEVDILGAAGPLLDAEILGDALIVYTTASAHAVRYIGGSSFFSVTKLPGNSGILTKGCVVDTPVGHVMLTTGDVVVHQGGEAKSIASGRVRKAIFGGIDNSAAERLTFLLHLPSTKEVMICYPEPGSGSCTKAAIWNYAEDAWSFRALRNVLHGGAGQTPPPPTDTYLTVVGSYAASTLTYGGQIASPNDTRAVFAHVTPAISVLDSGYQDLGLTLTATAERVGMSFGDPGKVKLLKRVWPRIDSTAGAVVYVQVGASMYVDGAVTWAAPVAFTVGTTQKVDVFAKGKFLAIRLYSTTDIAWRIRGLGFEVQPAGDF